MQESRSFWILPFTPFKLGFLAKLGNRFAKILENRRKKENFRFSRNFAALICFAKFSYIIFLKEIPHRFCFFSLKSFPRKTAKFREIRKKISHFFAKVL